MVMLLDAGVDPRILDAQLRTAMDIFKKNKKFREIDVINKHIARCMSFSEAKSGTLWSCMFYSTIANT